MANLSKQKTLMPTQEVEERQKNFREVALGYDMQLAKEEAERCLHCAHPLCVEGCPVHIQIPDFIQKIKEGKEEEAYHILLHSSCLPAICGRVCPQEQQCEKACIRGRNGEPVAIGRLERYVADTYRQLHPVKEYSNPKTKTRKEKIAVIGSGPSGLTVAGELLTEGYPVTLYEEKEALGGALTYGIPTFRLPQDVTQYEIQRLLSLGLQVQYNTSFPRDISLSFLQENYDAVFLGVGANVPLKMGIPGEESSGVYSAQAFLEEINMHHAYRDPHHAFYQAQNIIVVGGGNVAMDAARSAKRFGHQVTIVYRRGEEELPAFHDEIAHAKEEGIRFLFLTNPVAILANEQHQVYQIECAQMELGEMDASHRRRPIEKKGGHFFLPADLVILAISSAPSSQLGHIPHLAVTPKNQILIDEMGRTSLKGVYAGGDVVTGPATVILAMQAGKKAAKAIMEDIKKGN